MDNRAYTVIIVYKKKFENLFIINYSISLMVMRRRWHLHSITKVTFFCALAVVYLDA